MKKRRIDHETNTGMFADVSFLLLIFFMVVTTFNKAYEIQMKLPPLQESTRRGSINKDRVLNINLNDKSEVLIQDELYGLEESYSLVSGIERITSQVKPGVIKINMHPNTSYKDYVALLANIKRDKQLVIDKKSNEIFGKAFHEIEPKSKQALLKEVKYSIIEKEIETL